MFFLVTAFCATLCQKNQQVCETLQELMRWLVFPRSATCIIIEITASMFFFLAIAHHCENEERLHSDDLIFYMDTVGWNTLHHHNFIYCSRENIEKDRWPMWAFTDSGGTAVFLSKYFSQSPSCPWTPPPGPWETGPANPRLNSANTWYGFNTCAQFLLTLLLPRVVW